MTIFLVAREAEDAHAAVVLEDDGLVIELVAEPRLEAGLTAAHAPGSERRLVAQRPRGLVQAVHELLGGLVAREPVEVVPVPELILQLRLAGLAVADDVGLADDSSPGSPRSGRSLRRARASSSRGRPGRSASRGPRRRSATSTAPPRRRPSRSSGRARRCRAASRRRRACRRRPRPAPSWARSAMPA